MQLIIDLLKNSSSDHISILEDLNTLFEKRLIIKIIIKIDFKENIIFSYIVNNQRNKVGKMFLEMDFLSSARKIFEDEKKGNENIIV